MLTFTAEYYSDLGICGTHDPITCYNFQSDINGLEELSPSQLCQILEVAYGADPDDNIQLSGPLECGDDGAYFIPFTYEEGLGTITLRPYSPQFHQI